MLKLITFNPRLQECVFQSRYKRFFCDVQSPDHQGTLTVHCANSGSMKSCLIPGAPALISDSRNPNRKLRYTLEALYLEDGWVCLNTQRANEALATLMTQRDAITANSFEGADLFLREFSQGAFKSEAKYDEHTRFDGLIVHESIQHWIEVKSVSLRTSNTRIAFPDAVTTRGTKHLDTLKSSLMTLGTKATLIFAITRGSEIEAQTLINQFQIAEEIDPTYSRSAQSAQSAGVALRALILTIDSSGIGIRHYGPVSI